jgi:hypothetical protein
MSAITLESLGFTKEELQNRVVDQLCENILSGKGYDEDGAEYYEDSQFKKKLEERLKEHINATIGAIAEKHVLPNVTAYIENLCLQETNKWGEKTGQKVTFIEYLTQRADAYIREDVNYQGKSKSEGDSYNWSKNTSRISYLINSHLQYAIEGMTKAALANANKSIVGGIEQAVKIQLEQTLGKLKLDVKA